MDQSSARRLTPSAPLVTTAALLLVALGAFPAVLTAPDLQPPPVFWPSSAVEVFLLSWTLTTAPRRRWPVVWVTTAGAVLVGDLLGGRALDRSIGHAVLDVFGALLAAAVLTRGGRSRPRLQQVPDVVRLVLAGTLAGAVPAALGTALAARSAFDTGLLTCGTVVATHLAAVLLLVPLTMPAGRRRQGGRTELAGQLVLLALTVTFAVVLQREATVMTFAPVLLLAWAALRFETALVVVELAVLGAVVTVQAQVGHGPFTGLVTVGDLSELASGALTQIFLAAIALLILPLAVSTQHNAALVERITADARRFRRNFTQSLVGMAFLEPDDDGSDLVIADVNETAVAIIGGRQSDLIGRPLRQLVGAEAGYDAVLPELLTRVREGWRAECALTGPRGGHVNLQLSLLSTPGDVPLWAVQLVDITTEHQAREDLEATRGLVNHLMEASFTTALVGIDTDGMITVVNSGLQHLLGYDREELVGQPFHRLMNITDLLERTGADSPAAGFATLVRGLEVTGETRPRDWTWRTRSGVDRLVSMSLSVARAAATTQGGYLCVARDVAETRQSQQMLMEALDKERTAVERLRALDQAKSQFVSTVSHELRTPVTSIVGYTELMLDGTMVEPLPDQLPILATIGRNGKRLIAMIDDLLLLGGLDSGVVHTRRDIVDLAAGLGPIEESVRALVVGRDLHLEVDRHATAVPVRGDAAQLERVVINLISNAIKFTEDGGTITVSLAVEDDHAVLRVADTGIGIPAEEQAELFQRFFRSSTAQARQIQGTGLGLSIVSEIVAAHRGTISVTSVHLQGSTFVVRLPLAHAEQLAAAR